MNTDEFMQYVQERFEMSDVIFRDLKEYADKLRAHTRDRLAKAIRDNHSYSTIKTISVVKKIATDIGIRPEPVEFAHYVCDQCDTKFSMKSKGCPNCHEPLQTLRYHAFVAEKDEAHEIIMLNEDCWECKHYNPENEHCEGPTCGGWGKSHQSSPACRQCICSKCCFEKYLMLHEFRRFQAIDEAGELEDRLTGRKGA